MCNRQCLLLSLQNLTSQSEICLSCRIWTHPKTQGTALSPREMHTGCPVGSSQLFIYGGRSATSQILDDAAIFDTESLQWLASSSTGYPRCSHAAVAVPTCKLLCHAILKGGALLWPEPFAQLLWIVIQLSCSQCHHTALLQQSTLRAK